jgi:hypothetical protein
MRTLKLFVVGALLMIIFCHEEVAAQCQNKVELIKAVPVSSGLSNGQIEVKVKSNTAFRVDLIALEDSGERSTQARSGSGNQSFVFNNLSGNFLYKVKVEFSGADDFLCKTKAITNINLTGKQ